MRRARRSHGENSETDAKIKFLLIKILQRIILTGQNILKTGDLIRTAEEARELGANSPDLQTIIGTYNKILYNLANMYTNGANSEFERAGDILDEFRRLAENFTVSCDVVKSFNKLEKLIEVIN